MINAAVGLGILAVFLTLTSDVICDLVNSIKDRIGRDR